MEITNTYNEKVKQSILKWRDANPEKWQEQNKKNCKSYYYKNREALIKKKLEKYYQKLDRASSS
jgi:hypothetical protein